MTGTCVCVFLFIWRFGCTSRLHACTPSRKQVMKHSRMLVFVHNIIHGYLKKRWKISKLPSCRPYQRDYQTTIPKVQNFRGGFGDLSDRRKTCRHYRSLRRILLADVAWGLFRTCVQNIPSCPMFHYCRVTLLTTRCDLFTSAHGHYSVEKAAQMFGFGSKAVRSVVVDVVFSGRCDLGRKMVWLFDPFSWCLQWKSMLWLRTQCWKIVVEITKYIPKSCQWISWR